MQISYSLDGKVGRKGITVKAKWFNVTEIKDVENLTLTTEKQGSMTGNINFVTQKCTFGINCQIQ